MFGGHGLFLDDLMFALLDGGEMWFKGDDLNRRLYLDGGGRVFTYRRRGRSIAMSYYSVPDEVRFDPDRLIAWAESAFAAARRNRRRR